ncbi:hypothetical protein [Pseudonocardia sp.]|jgi:hypothetical protein|uniref:hypothetical protein n=1 Tax=Pseudonocardia sp. TaxID=60912 RepID=UPI002D8FEB50|nr:hypothetical protein [Pseudonocardia sp.]
MGIEDPDADVVEQLTPIEDDDDAVEDPSGLPLEADPADVAEQRQVVPVEDPSELPLEADPADVAEQRQVVPEYDDEPR